MALRTRPLLIYSLGALIVLIAVTGAAALVMFGRIRSGESGLRTRFDQRRAALERIRTGIYLSGTLARDYFLHQLAQRRESMLRIADSIGATLDREWKQGQADLARMYTRLRAIFAAELSLVVILGILLSVGTVRRLVRLEGETRALSAQL